MNKTKIKIKKGTCKMNEFKRLIIKQFQ